MAKKTVIFCLMAIGFLMGASAGCNRSEGEILAESSPISTAIIDEPNTIECTGVLHPARRFILRAEPGEEMETLNVSVGEEVREGDVLAILSCPALQADWASTHEKILALRKEEAKLDTARWRKSLAEERRLEIQKRLDVEETLRGKVEGYDPQVQARELMEAQRGLEQEIEGLGREIALGVRLQPEVDSLLRVQEKHISWLDQRMSNLVVTAPFSGMVVRAEVPAPAPSGIWLEVHDRDEFRVQGLLWQNQLAGIGKGRVVTIVPDFMSGTEWKGTVKSIGYAAMAEPTQSFPRFPITVELSEGPDAGTLRDGMTVSMKIHSLTSQIEEP